MREEIHSCTYYDQYVIGVNQYSEQIYLLGPLACILQSGIFFSPVAADNQISMH